MDSKIYKNAHITDKQHGAALWYTILIIGVVAASASGAIIKMAQTDKVPPLVIAAIRNYVACIALLPFFLSGSWREIRGLTRKEIWLIAASGLVLAFHFAMWIMSLERTSVASATIFITTTPIFVVLGSHYFLHEKTSPLIYIGIIISIAGGILVLIARDEPGNLAGNMLALVGAIAASIYMLIGRRVRQKLHLVPYIFVVYGIAAISLTITSLAMGNSFTGYTPKAYALVVLLGLVSSLIGHTSINFVLRHLRSYIVSIMMLGEPVSATLIAVIFIGMKEAPRWLEAAGSLVMLIGIYAAIKVSSKD